eukprot:Em0012g719a
MMQSYITEIGRMTRMYCELAQRNEPTLSDVQLALLEAGAEVKCLADYSKRPQRRNLPRQPRTFPQSQPKCLQVGGKVPHPPHIPNHLPQFPDPHTYIRTPTFTAPNVDYRCVREKLAVHRRSSCRGLSKLLSKTRDSRPVAGDSDPSGSFTVIINVAPTVPAYLQALMPSPEDQIEPAIMVSSQNEDSMVEDGEQGGTHGGGGGDASEDTPTSPVNAQGNSERFENPFMKPAKRVKVKPS